ncbi:MAG TPA: hypothetical protein VGD56_15185, partial [Gemmatirosa sp.]
MTRATVQRAIRRCAALLAAPVVAAAQMPRDTAPAPTLLVPARVFDAPAGVARPGWVVLVRGGRIAAVGP